MENLVERFFLRVLFVRAIHSCLRLRGDLSFALKDKA